MPTFNTALNLAAQRANSVARPPAPYLSYRGIDLYELPDSDGEYNKMYFTTDHPGWPITLRNIVSVPYLEEHLGCLGVRPENPPGSGGYATTEETLVMLLKKAIDYGCFPGQRSRRLDPIDEPATENPTAEDLEAPKAQEARPHEDLLQALGHMLASEDGAGIRITVSVIDEDEAKEKEKPPAGDLESLLGILEEFDAKYLHVDEDEIEGECEGCECCCNDDDDEDECEGCEGCTQMPSYLYWVENGKTAEIIELTDEPCPFGHEFSFAVKGVPELDPWVIAAAFEDIPNLFGYSYDSDTKDTKFEFEIGAENITNLKRVETFTINLLIQWLLDHVEGAIAFDKGTGTLIFSKAKTQEA